MPCLGGYHSNDNGGGNSTRDQVLYYGIYYGGWYAGNEFLEVRYCIWVRVGICQPTNSVEKEEVSDFSCLTPWQSRFYKEEKREDVNKDLESWLNIQVFDPVSIFLELCNYASKKGYFASEQRRTRLQNRNKNPSNYLKRMGGKKILYKSMDNIDESSFLEMWNS